MYVWRQLFCSPLYLAFYLIGLWFLKHSVLHVCPSLYCRCKVNSDLTLNGRLPCTAHCEKCDAGIRAAFRPSMLHHYSDVLGYLDLKAALAVDLILQESEFSVGCLNCDKEDTIKVWDDIHMILCILSLYMSILCSQSTHKEYNYNMILSDSEHIFWVILYVFLMSIEYR